MNSVQLSFREDNSPQTVETIKDARIIDMMNSLKNLKKSRKGDYNVKDLRDLCPLLYSLTYRLHSNSSSLKAKGTWTSKPENWPEHIFFGDPNNRGTSEHKPKEAELRPMFKHLVNTFYYMHSNYCDENMMSFESGGDYSFPLTSSQISFTENSALKSNFTNPLSSTHDSYREVNEKKIGDFAMDENNVISVKPAQSNNMEVDAKYKALDELLKAANEYLDMANQQTLFSIFQNLFANQSPALLLQIFEAVLKDIVKEKGLSVDAIKTITNNFGELMNYETMEQKPQIKKLNLPDEGGYERELNLQEVDIYNIYNEDFSDIKLLIEDTDIDRDNPIENINFIENIPQGPIQFRNIGQNYLGTSHINNADNSVYSIDPTNPLFQDERLLLNLSGVEARMVTNNFIEVPVNFRGSDEADILSDFLRDEMELFAGAMNVVDIHSHGDYLMNLDSVLTRNLELDGILQKRDEMELVAEAMDVVDDHNYGTVGDYLLTSDSVMTRNSEQVECSSYGSKIPVTVEHFETINKNKSMKQKRRY